MSHPSQATALQSCPLCQGGMKRLFEAADYRRPSHPESYAVVWCAGCGYGRLAKALLPSEVLQFYEVEYYTHQTAEPLKDAPNFWEKLRTYVAWKFDDGVDFSPQELGRPGKILDLGCGSGTNLAQLQAAGFEGVGVEPDPKARQVAAQHGAVWPGTAEAPPPEVGTGYDYVLMSHVLEHTLSPARSLACAHKLLTPEGQLIVEVPNCEAMGFKLFGPLWPWTDIPRHIHFFTQNSLEAFLAQAGFSVVKVFHTGFTRQFAPQWVETLNTIHTTIHNPDYSKSWLTRQSWGLLLRSLLAPAPAKFDSMRVHAIKGS